MSKTIVAIFKSFDMAEKAAYQIRDNGLRTDNISILVKDNHTNSYNHQPIETGKILSLSMGLRERITDGIITGGILGGIAGIIAGAAGMFFQGPGMIAAAGPITGLITGFAAGGLIGALVDSGMPKIKGQEYEKLISDGNVFFSMKADEDRIEQIIELLKENGALRIENY